MEDLLLTRAECGQQLVLDRMERISSLSKVSTRKHDRTHRKWFNDIISQLVGASAFKQVALDMSSGKLKHAKERRWSNNRAQHWKPVDRSTTQAPSGLRIDEIPYLEHLFKDFGSIYNPLMRDTRICMQVSPPSP